MTLQKWNSNSFSFYAGKTKNSKAIGKMIDKLSAKASLYTDNAYTDYDIEDMTFERKSILLKMQYKWNSKRIATLEQKQWKAKNEKRVEIAMSDIKQLYPRTMYAVTLEDFLIKLTSFIFVLQLNKQINSQLELIMEHTESP